MYCCQTVKEQPVSQQPPLPADAPCEEVRTAKQPPVPPAKALEKLRAGNQRYVEGRVVQRTKGLELRSALATQGQNPMAAIVSCADSRCPIEIVFDAQPGDLFVLRNAGNTCTHAEGSIVGSLEYSTAALKTSLVLVLGHTKCGAIAGATKTFLAKKDEPRKPKPDGERPTALEVLLESLGPVAAAAMEELPQGASVEEIAAHAVKVNVFHTMDKLLEYSEGLRERVRNREVQVHGAIYCIDSGRVDFIGLSPNLRKITDSTAPPPAVTPRYSVDLGKSPDDAAEEPAQADEQPKEAPRTPGRGSQSETRSTPKGGFMRWYQHLRK